MAFNCTLKRYDLNTRKEINFFVSQHNNSEKDGIHISKELMPYFGKFDNNNGKYILTGGSSPNQAKIIDISNKPYALFNGFDKELYCGEWSHRNDFVALSGADGIVRIYQVAF